MTTDTTEGASYTAGDHLLLTTGHVFTREQWDALVWLSETPSGCLWVNMTNQQAKALDAIRDVRIGRKKILRRVKSRDFVGVAVSDIGKRAIAAALAKASGRSA